MLNKKLFHIGDKVILLNDTLSGIILNIDNQIVTIKCENGFIHKFNQNELIKKGSFDSFLIDENLHQVINEKERRDIKNKVKTSKNNPILEIDLHVHQLIDSEIGMNNFDKLNLQLRVAKKQLEKAITKKAQRLIFIHGVGQGVLKKELYKLFKNYPVEFYDASFKKYGQGATEVYIYQNR